MTRTIAAKGRVTLPDVALRDHTLETLPRISELRRRHFATPTEVCIERARLVTEYLKRAGAGDAAPAPLRRAGAIHHYLSRRRPLFHDDNLLAGSTTSKAIGAPVYPELVSGLAIWPELDTISTRAVNPQKLTREEVDVLNLEVFPYWMDRTVLEVTRRQFDHPKSLELFERIVFFICGKAGCISHCVPTYEAALHRGLRAVVGEVLEREAGASGDEAIFFQAVRVALEGILAYAANLSRRAGELAQSESDPWRRGNLEAMAAICARVPAEPARSFRDAVNSLWLCQVGIHAENINMAMSPGRLDQVLYPFFARDLEEGRLGIDEALELGCCLWLKIADNTNLVPETAERLWGGAGSTPAVTLGGVDAAGNDAVNDLTYVLLKVTELMKLRDPSVNARYHYEANDRTYRQRVCETVVDTGAVPAFHNDVTDIATLVNQGETLEHARDYAIVGCVELASTGRDYPSSSSIMFNLAAPMEMALFDGKRRITGDEQVGPRTGDPRSFDSFDQFWEAFSTQLGWLIDQACALNRQLGQVHAEILPTPLLSAFFEGCLENGTDLVSGGALYNSSGASHVAFPDVCDSLNAIEFAVFEERKMTMAEMVAAVESDFAPPYDRFLDYLKNKVPRFGTEHPIALANSRRLVRFLYDAYQAHTNYRGGPYRPAYWTMTTHAGQGKLAGALPSGRRAGQVFSSGITPASQAAASLVEAYNAVASLPAEWIPGGEALNIKYTPLAANGGDADGRRRYLDRFGDLVEGYFRQGGLQVQYNINDYRTFIDAKNNPDKYPQMIVRVSGYSAYFKDLSDAMKDELILRTQYDLAEGKAVQLPPGWEPEST